MNLKLPIILGTLFMIINTYHDGKYIALLKSWKKYYVMGGYLLIGFFVISFINKNPQDGLSLVKHATNTIKYMPIDKEASNFLLPVLKHATSFVRPEQDINSNQMYSLHRDYNFQTKDNKLKETSTTTKRSVGETKKKYIAAKQNWTCAHCKCQLPAWFEVDHIKRLQYGGTNDINNLEALCRDCHGKKTAEEHLNII